LRNIDRSSPVRNTGLIEYWNVLHGMGHTVLLAFTPGSRPWLVDMAGSFVWVNWTLSFALLRERTLWLAALAARAAVAFGEPVIEKYLSALSFATHPMKSFDAIFGLIAIALDQSHIANELIAELIKQRGILARRNFPHAAYTNLMLETAIRTLREPDIARQDAVASLGIRIGSSMAWRGCSRRRRSGPTRRMSCLRAGILASQPYR
jgi:hypothetical protein